MRKSLLSKKALLFGVRMMKLYKHLSTTKHEYVVSKQALRSGTSIGACSREASSAESKADFIHKLSIAKKEADETMYWLELLHAAEYLSDKEFQSLYSECEELFKIITSSILTTQQKLPIKIGKKPTQHS